MTVRAAAPRKGLPAKEEGKGSAATIRVARPIAVAPSRPATVSDLLAKDPPAQVGSAHEQLMPEELPQAPGLPCSGRCGRCHHDPCRLHASV